jgi:hypothetical protein
MPSNDKKKELWKSSTIKNFNTQKRFKAKIQKSKNLLSKDNFIRAKMTQQIIFKTKKFKPTEKILTAKQIRFDKV